ncbi:excinuclease ABC subunit UvrC [Aquifex aeolicus]|uniref:UvrABC system protein C n=1 Tax=Aquifex aeolicus (strain VF5) TaxID=224324 RepID=UVRC_AQUAE|nr:excinuclease ABC subunit UvrC [Aquifex aeolicus]O67887.1 RecName: Full=UvrABC system protein C; Short=Protein UvrC; AltName: Full=Excinuclease ABC subunit C [Aquifex aeolicus VF5]AAC07850.1 repair excision nuclease subunit C [Aquifex aeolicus VF5]
MAKTGKVENLIQNAPEKPGVYLFKKGNRPIYIGKAKNLKKRLLQHLKASEYDSKERAIISNSDNLEWIVTRNEYEALVLEIDLIQQYKPRYNVLHKFGGGYPMLLLTKDEYPTIKVVRGTEHEGELFGPFLQSKKAYKVKKLIHNLFKLRTCDPLPKRSEPCMDYHLGLCSAPCCGFVSKEEYELAVSSARALLTGEVAEVLPKLYEKIEEFSKELMFEKCAHIRDQIIALENLAKGQAVSALPFREGDIFYKFGSRLGLLLVRSSKLVSKEIFDLESDEEVEEVILGYYYSNYVPRKVITNFELSEEVKEWIRNRAKGEVEFSGEIPKELKEVLEENLGEGINEEVLKKEFAEKLGMPVPRVIEGFDISHFYGEDIVGSCVVWKGGKMSKKDYRRYKVKTISRIDDYLALEEVLTRRAKRILKGEVEKPDIWLIDGGKGQLNVGIRVKKRTGLDVKVFSLAKEEEIIYTEDGREIRLKENPILYRVFGEIRDEAHRFALSYNRKLREKRYMEDILSKIKGIGEQKKKIIYKNFETLYDFIEAKDEELRRLGINPSLKQEVKKWLS